MAECFEISLAPGTDTARFEDFFWNELVPHFTVLRRAVRATIHRLLKQQDSDCTRRYIWLVVVAKVGATPATAGAGPEVIASNLGWLEDASRRLGALGVIALFREVTNPLTAEQPK